MTSQDPTKLPGDLRKWAESLQQKAARYGELQQQLDRTNVTVTSPDGAIRITVDATGVPKDITLTDRARGVDPAQLSTELMATLRQAHGKMRDQVSELTIATVGDDGAGADMLAKYRERFPDEPPSTAYGDDDVMRFDVEE